MEQGSVVDMCKIIVIFWGMTSPQRNNPSGNPPVSLSLVVSPQKKKKLPTRDRATSSKQEQFSVEFKSGILVVRVVRRAAPTRT